MRLFFKNVCIAMTVIFIVSNSSVPASAQSTDSDSITSMNSYLFLPQDSVIQNKSTGFIRVNAGLNFSRLGFAQMSTTAIIVNDSNYVTIKMQLQRYKSGKWNVVTSGTSKGKGLSGYSRNYYVSKGYKYRVKSTLSLYKSKNGKLLKTDTCYSNVKKR